MGLKQGVQPLSQAEEQPHINIYGHQMQIQRQQ